MIITLAIVETGHIMALTIQGKPLYPLAGKEKGILTAEVRKIMHVHDGDKSLMLRILSNKQFFAAFAIVHQIENYIHAGDSIAIQKSINKNMKSSKLSKDTVSSIKKLNPKEKVSVYQMVKSFVDICCARLAFRLLPISSDVVTDSLRLKEINEDLSNINATTQNNSKGVVLKLFYLFKDTDNNNNL